jgi:LPXTG-site transpeptidase (sortase) family protein
MAGGKKSKLRSVLSLSVTLLLVLIVIGCVWYLVVYFTTGKEVTVTAPILAPQVTSPVDETPVTPEQKKEYTVPATHPRYLSIPDLGIVNSRIVSIGFYKGALDSPANINDVAWYRDSSTPGSGGAVLIDGHNGGTTKDGIFAKLGTLAVGSNITVERGDGQKFTYKVVENNSVDIADVNGGGMAKMLQSAEQGKEGLNLITCDGVYDKSVKQFNRRIMLRAVLEP